MPYEQWSNTALWLSHASLFSCACYTVLILCANQAITSIVQEKILNHIESLIIRLAHCLIIRACQWVSHNALFLKSQTHSVNVHDSIYDIDWVFLEIPVKNCIVGMLLTCPLILAHLRCVALHTNSIHQH